MARVIEEVAVKIGADTRGLNKGMTKAKKQVSGLTSAFKRLGGTLAAAFGARALFRGFKRTLDTADQLIKTAKGVGFTVNEYQRLTFALDQVGVSAGSAKIALGDFQKRLSKAVAGVSPQFQKAFEQAGLDTKALSAMSPAAAFSAAMVQLSTLRNDPRIAGLTGNVFEEQSGKDILQVLRQWEKYMAAREKFGRAVGELSREQVRNLQSAREEAKLLGQQWSMLKMQIVGDAAPAITAALTKLNESGLLRGMGREVSGMIEMLGEFSQALKLVLMDYEKLTGHGLPGRGAATSAKNKRTGISFTSDVGDISPSGIFSKTISGETINRARVGQKQLHSRDIISTSNRYEINVQGFSDGAKAGKAVRKELDKRVNAP